MGRFKNMKTGLVFGTAIAGMAAWLFARQKGEGKGFANSGQGGVLSEIGGQNPNPEDAPLDGRLQNRLGLGGGAEGSKLTQPREETTA